MEALAAGLPVITTRACGLPAAAAACSTQVALGSAEGLAAAIAALAADLGRRQRHGHAGTALVRDHFGPDNFSRAVAALYDQILAGPPAVPSPAPAP
jgi:glycosyltransferase involved in cell wall biosynthesis